MNDTVISVENLGKSYLIRHQVGGPSYRRLSEEIVNAVRRPFRALGRRRPQNGGSPEAVAPPTKERFWALKDVSFEVKRGEVLGIIGRNGAGKSTLLKVLSRITEPTEGRVRTRGRVASLLEVGTGFHPELTGRENIFLNGTILGMTRREIQKKFDEIVAFAEVEKFLDTPVKRYSSGMYVRLAFAVAAHLEPEILIVDEVLAVGDLQFQKKCLGKMQDVARMGRTILFVSHNMSAVRNLTQSAILLELGEVAFSGESARVIERYVHHGTQRTSKVVAEWGAGVHTRIRGASMIRDDGIATEQYLPSDRFRVEVEFETDGTRGMSLDMIFEDFAGTRIGLASLTHFSQQELPARSGQYRCVLDLGALPLASGMYSVDITTAHANVGWDHYVRSALKFEVPYSDIGKSAWDFRQAYGYGSVALKCVTMPEFERLRPPTSC